MSNSQRSLPEWSSRIKGLIDKVHLSQANLAKRVGVSPATVTRWIKGTHEPTSAAYVAMGNLIGAPEGIYFWERAGMESGNFAGTNPRIPLSSLQVSLKEFSVVLSTKVSSKVTAKRSSVVVLPLLNIVAYGDRVPPKENVSFTEAKVLEVLMAPLAWCPHPESMISMRVDGDSMEPLIPHDSIIIIDTAITERNELDEKLTVFSHRDLGFKLARLKRLSSSDILVSANHAYLPLDVSDESKWKSFGRVMWWVSKDPMGLTRK